jgi:hypothetical protein
MTENAVITDFSSPEADTTPPDYPTLEERLLNPISSTLGLCLLAGANGSNATGKGRPRHPRYRDRYLFRDEHARWFILYPSPKASEHAHVRWVYLPDDKPTRFARVGLKRRSAIGYDYVRSTEAPDPIRTTVTANELASEWGDTTYECFTCGYTFDAPLDHAVHCWEEHPSIPTPSQIRLEREE